MVMKAGFIFTSQKENQGAWFEKKEEAPRKFKNEWSIGLVMLTAFCDCHGFMYVEFGPDASKENRNAT